VKLLLLSGACEFRTLAKPEMYCSRAVSQSTAGKVRSGSVDRSERKELKSIDYTTFLFHLSTLFHHFFILHKGLTNSFCGKGYERDYAGFY
jgi:hypothetical protein